MAGKKVADTQLLEEMTIVAADAEDDKNKGPIRRETMCSRVPEIRHRIDHVLHNRKMEICVIVLVIIDAFIVIAELLIDLGLFGEPIKKSDLPKALHYISIVILSVFVVEVSLKIFALAKRFFKSFMNILDALIVFVSFIVDIIFLDDEKLHEAVGLVVLLRLWRVVRIVNSIIMSVRTEAEMKLEHKDKEIAELRQRVEELEAMVVALGGSPNSPADAVVGRRGLTTAVDVVS